MVSEDFSFPKITNPIPHFTFTPSLWRVSSPVYPDFNDEDNNRQVDFSKRNFSCLESEVKRDSEEKMDMLWEDFNEELQRVSSLGNKKDAKRLSRGGLDSEPSRAMVELCCLQAMRMSKTNSGMIYHHKRPRSRMLMVKKVLKKILLLKNSVQIKK